MFKNMLMPMKRYTNNLIYPFVTINKRLISINSFAAQSFQKWYRDLWRPRRNNHCQPPYEHFTQIGDPVLRAQAAPVPIELIQSKEVGLVIEKMKKVLNKYKCVGIAAPQIGISLRVIVMQFNGDNMNKYNETVQKVRQMSILPLTVVINPVLKVTNYEKYKHPEGCMSVRGYTAEVERYAEVTLTGYNRFGETIALQLKGWNARIAQHEVDHLHGKLYIDQMDHSTFCSVCWEAVNTHGGRLEIPFYK